MPAPDARAGRRARRTRSARARPWPSSRSRSHACSPRPAAAPARPRRSRTATSAASTPSSCACRPRLELDYAVFDGKLVIATSLAGIAARSRRSSARCRTIRPSPACWATGRRAVTSLVFLDFASSWRSANAPAWARTPPICAVRDDLSRMRAVGVGDVSRQERNDRGDLDRRSHDHSYSDNEYLFTSESVTEGHPDKIADQISDGVLDAVMRDDPYGRVACETLVNTGLVVVSGEISTDTYVDIQEIARETIRKIGYTDADLGFSADSCAVINAIDKQSPDIAQGVDPALRGAHRPVRRRRARRRRRRRPGHDVRLRDARDARADAAADLARAQAGQAAGRRAPRRGRALPAPGRQDPGLGPLPRRAAGGDREAADLDPAQGGRGVADPRRPVGARRRADPAQGPLRRAQAARATSSSTRPAASSSAGRWATPG